MTNIQDLEDVLTNICHKVGAVFKVGQDTHPYVPLFVKLL
jgi:hypothetical protein